jgi:feruloyl esterase
MNASSAQLDEFMRFFRVSGMGHCGGGPGAWMIGQGMEQGTGFEARGNVLASIVEWVEQGNAPEVLEGVKFVDDSVAEGVGFRRRHCRYVSTMSCES